MECEAVLLKAGKGEYLYAYMESKDRNKLEGGICWNKSLEWDAKYHRLYNPQSSISTRYIIWFDGYPREGGAIPHKE